MYNFNSQMCGLIAQSVEQMTENHRVGGSIPPQATTPFRNPNYRFNQANFFLGCLFLQ